MPGKIRIQFQGASYHIMSRGDQYEPIFLSDKDRHSFLKTPGETCQHTGWIIHGYVLMDNHYHMLVETPEANLVEQLSVLPETTRETSFMALCVEKVFHELKIYNDNAAGRKKYLQYMNLRVKEVLNPKNKQKFEKEWMKNVSVLENGIWIVNGIC